MIIKQRESILTLFKRQIPGLIQGCYMS